MSEIYLTQFIERAARLHPYSPAIRFENRESTWHSFNEATRHLAAGLEALDIGSDDRVAILALNSDR